MSTSPSVMRSKRINKKQILLIVLLAGLAVSAIGWYLTQPSGNELKASGTLQTTEIKVGSQVGGRVSAVMATEGQTVEADQILLSLDALQLPEQRMQVEGQLQQAQATLAKLRHGYLPEEIAQAQAGLLEAQAAYQMASVGPRREEVAQVSAQQQQSQAQYNLAEANYNRFETLLKKNVVSRQEFDTAKSQYESARQQLEASNQRLLEFKNGSRAEELEQAKARLQRQQAQLALYKRGARSEDIAAQQGVVKALEAQLASIDKSQVENSIKSPCHCQVASLDIKPGQLLLPSQTVATLINPNDLWVRVYIPEESFGLVALGEEVSLLFDAYGPNRPFKGKVVQLASKAEFTPRNVQTEKSRRMQVFGVKVQVDNKEGLLRPGMIADVIMKKR